MTTLDRPAQYVNRAGGQRRDQDPCRIDRAGQNNLFTGDLPEAERGVIGHIANQKRERDIMLPQGFEASQDELFTIAFVLIGKIDR